ncbi:hypothetical protein SP058_00420 [Salmonella phage FSL SP-058]|uniref:Uncharacterized protein n=1 Tax=Salmonella phage FSL SP-058 TaxID=1173761 RepID=S4TNJ8_9CAUD|nr:hypothetical protein SP058_00420 [Salmonella phage FSL SP-058]AGF88199.1 hypothetical protein SP058_00420 [Salmonella phage FSL SP-058]
MTGYYIVWNEQKSEGILLRRDDPDSEADIIHAAGGPTANPVSSLADSFRELYGEEQQCSIQEIDIDPNSSKDLSEF